jgi:V/A-type H+-transporting ATPase subunit I
MFRPEEMTRAVIVGSIDSLETTVRCLYELDVLHLIDFTSQDEEFKLGQPLPNASEASQKLLKLRSVIRALGIEEHRPESKFKVAEVNKRLEQALVTLDVSTSGKVEARQKITSLIRDRENDIRTIEPFRSFGIPIENYEGYDSISVFTGICRSDPEEAFVGKFPQSEIFVNRRKADFVVAAYVPNGDRLEASRVLASSGFQELRMPKLKGHIDAVIDKLAAEKSSFEKDLERIDAELEVLRSKFADFILASEEHLAIEVLKAETPLRIATSANSFVIDGWILKTRVDDVRAALENRCCGLTYLEAVPPEKNEDPPVKLKNPKPAKPFELFMSLLSTPKYDEVDPTVILSITFPVFFGFMIGDLGFGLALAFVGAFLWLRVKSIPDLRTLGAIVLAGGIMASLFGLFVFAEAFGVPFHPPPEAPEEHSWESVADIPIHPMIEKMYGVTEMLAISIVAGWIHLTLGYVFGFVNTYRHSRKHAIGKIAWLVILLGLFIELMTIAGNATVTSEFVNSTIFSPFTSLQFLVIGIEVSSVALGLIIAGVVGLVFTEGVIALTEVLGVFTNLMSYMRLAALAIGKGAVALAFNTMFFPLIFEGHSIAIAIVAVIILVLAQTFIVFLLGAFSAGIQAIRLNYVEFFLKFFEGGGTEFSPLGYRRKYSIEAE